MEVGTRVNKYTKWTNLWWRWHIRYYIIRDSILYYDRNERFDLKSAKHHTFIGACDYKLENNGNIIIYNGAKEQEFKGINNNNEDEFIEFKKKKIIDGISSGKKYLKEKGPNVIIPDRFSSNDKDRDFPINNNNNTDLIEEDKTIGYTI